jgi:hypothetical protein
VVSPCEHGNESFGSVKRNREFPWLTEKLSASGKKKNALNHGVKLTQSKTDFRNNFSPFFAL